MSMQLRILHRTAYRYDETVKYSAQALRLTPRREGTQRVLSWGIHAPGRRIEQVDAHGNVTHLLTLEDPHQEIEIVVSGSVEVAAEGTLMPHEGPLSPLAYLAGTPLTAADEAIAALAKQHLGDSRPVRDRLYALAGAVQDRVHYKKGSSERGGHRRRRARARRRRLPGPGARAHRLLPRRPAFRPATSAATCTRAAKTAATRRATRGWTPG